MALLGLISGARDQVVCSLRWEWEVKVPELGTTVFVIPGRPVERIGWEATKTKQDQVLVLNRAARSVNNGQRSRDSEWAFVYRARRTDRINNSGWRKAWKDAG
jgi:hypothetical protein